MLGLQTRRNQVGRWRFEYVLAMKGRGADPESALRRDELEPQLQWALNSPPVDKVRQKRKRRAYCVNLEVAFCEGLATGRVRGRQTSQPFMEEFLEALERHDEPHLPKPPRSSP